MSNYRYLNESYYNGIDDGDVTWETRVVDVLSLEMGEDFVEENSDSLNHSVTFRQAWDCLKSGKDIYALVGVYLARIEEIIEEVLEDYLDVELNAPYDAYMRSEIDLSKLPITERALQSKSAIKVFDKICKDENITPTLWIESCFNSLVDTCTFHPLWSDNRVLNYWVIDKYRDVPEDIKKTFLSYIRKSGTPKVSKGPEGKYGHMEFDEI